MKAMISFIVTFPLLSVAIATSPYPNSTASDLDLGDYYRTYLTLKSRKKNRTAFFTSVIEQLLKRMESDEL